MSTEPLPIDCHSDRIWTSGCYEKEIAIGESLASNSIEHQLVDHLEMDKHYPPSENFVTDNIIHGHENQYKCIAPLFWHIWLFDTPIDYKIQPFYKFNCLMNRADGARQRLLYKLFLNSMHYDGIISYNCQGLERLWDTWASVEQRRGNFKNLHAQAGAIQEYKPIFEMLQSLVPILTDYNPESAAMDSLWTIVPETYCTEYAVSLSEKIFRALQTPRPWAIQCSTKSVQALRKAGFDTLDDLVDHDYYDLEPDPDIRQTKMLELVNTSTLEYNNDTLARFEQAALHNRTVLENFSREWPSYFENLLQSISSNNQS